MSWRFSFVLALLGNRTEPLLATTGRLYRLRPHVIRMDAGYWGLRLIAWIHTTLGAVAILPWNPKRQQHRDGLPPT